jgi:hypothetical protein
MLDTTAAFVLSGEDSFQRYGGRVIVVVFVAIVVKNEVIVVV